MFYLADAFFGHKYRNIVIHQLKHIPVSGEYLHSHTLSGTPGRKGTYDIVGLIAFLLPESNGGSFQNFLDKFELAP